MTLNSYFLQGSPREQNLVQDLINEQIQIYGVDVYYLPRKIFKTDNIIKEIPLIASKQCAYIPTPIPSAVLKPSILP